MRIDAKATTLSWIPSEAVTGMNKAIFGTGFTHYDPPPPDQVDDLEALKAEDRFRFANDLRAWVEVEDGTITKAGYGEGSGIVMGATTLALGGKEATFAAVSFDDIQQPAEVQGDRAVFVQTVGGHTAVPAPRRVNHPPFVAFEAPTVWTTLTVTVHADGSVDHELTGASAFPRHWVYDGDGALSHKAGMANFKEWWRHSFGKHTPWGDQDSPALVTAVETALEREVATSIMRGGAKPEIRRLKQGEKLTEQGQPGDEVFLLLDGVLTVDVDGELMAEVGPGAIVGERALIEGGLRTSTLLARTKAKVAVATAADLDPEVLATISEQHRREEAADGAGGG